MDADEKRKLAEMLAPHLAWELSRSEVLGFYPDTCQTATGQEMFIQNVVQILRGKMARGEPFKVAIIPVTPPAATP